MVRMPRSANQSEKQTRSEGSLVQDKISAKPRSRQDEVRKCPKGHTNINPYMFKNNTDRYYCSDCQTTYGIEDGGVTGEK